MPRAAFSGPARTAPRSERDDKALYPVEGPVPEHEELIPFGKSEIRCEGADLTLVGGGPTVATCIESASKLESDGMSAEVIDLRTLSPLESKTIVTSVEKWGNLYC